MDVDKPEQDQGWDTAERSETVTERLDRNLASLLQEMRIVQTGVQLLTGFLMTLPFQARFDRLDGQMRIIYLITVVCAVWSTLCLVAPVAMHRLLFRQRRLKQLVTASHRFALVGLLLLAFALAGVTMVIFAMVIGKAAAWIAAACGLVSAAGMWLIIPVLSRRAARD